MPFNNDECLRLFKSCLDESAGSRAARFFAAVCDFDQDFQSTMNAAKNSTFAFFYDKSQEKKEKMFDAQLDAKAALRKYNFWPEHVERVISAMTTAAKLYAR